MAGSRDRFHLDFSGRRDDCRVCWFCPGTGIVEPGLVGDGDRARQFCRRSGVVLGRAPLGPRLLERFPRWQRRVDAALRWLERYDADFILTFRFIYGVRNFSSFAMGLSAVRARRFLVLPSPGRLRSSRASPAVVEACVSLLRRAPPTSKSALTGGNFVGPRFFYRRNSIAGILIENRFAPSIEGSVRS